MSSVSSTHTKVLLLGSVGVSLGATLVGALPAAAAAGAGAAVLPALCTLIGGAAQSVSGTFLSDRLRQPLRLRDLLVNRDLNRAVVQALAALVEQTAGTVSPADQQKALRKAAREVALWRRRVQGARGRRLGCNLHVRRLPRRFRNRQPLDVQPFQVKGERLLHVARDFDPNINAPWLTPRASVPGGNPATARRM